MGWVWEQCLTYVVHYVCGGGGGGGGVGGGGGGVATASISQPDCQQLISWRIYTYLIFIILPKAARGQIQSL
jgi:hypothetical protein